MRIHCISALVEKKSFIETFMQKTFVCKQDVTYFQPFFNRINYCPTARKAKSSFLVIDVYGKGFVVQELVTCFY